MRISDWSSDVCSSDLKTDVKHVITTQVGDLLPLPKRVITNLVVKRVKKMVPAWEIRGAVSFREALAKGRTQPYTRLPLGPGDIAFLQYTGGTTGLSKGAVLTHGNVVANLEQLSAWMGPFLDEGKEVIIRSEEHKSELQSLMRNSYALLCLKK